MATRELPLEELYAGYYETVLEKNELITAVTVPALNGRKGRLHESHVAFRRRLAGARRRRLVCAARTASMRDPIVVVSAATEKVTRMASAEKVLQGAAPDDAVLTRAGEAAADGSFDPRRRARLGRL